MQLSSSINHQQLHLPNDPLIPFVRSQIAELTAQSSSLVAENERLNSKLIESTEGRMDLDQQLNITQMELHATQKELETLRENQKDYERLLSMVSSGQLIEKKDVEPMIENLVYESQRRSQIETSKMKLESELEDLSRSLFEEANRMVKEERQVTHQARKKIEGLERQLEEVLDLCKSERDQLAELKVRMTKLSDEKDIILRERDALEFALVQQQQQQHQLHLSSSPTSSIHHHITTTTATRRGVSSTSSSLTGSTFGPNMDSTMGARKHVPHIIQYEPRPHRSSASSVKSKTDSCFFSDEDHPESHLPNDPHEDRVPTLGFHLWDPSFIEFKTYIESVFGTSGKSNGDLDMATSSMTSAGITSMYSFNIMNRPAPAATPASNAVIPISSLLSNCRLLKKMLAEDVEATLRFEPGNLLSWAQRKRLMAAVTENTLVIEVVNVSSKDQSPSPVATAHSLSPSATAPVATATTAKPNCALCGHGINTPLYYQYRLMDTSNESRTICPYCRTRLTSVCNFYSVLRMISKRIISSTTTPEKLYLDFLRIRLSMFLARCGVGIATGDEVVRPKRESTRSHLASSGVQSLPPPPRASAKLVTRSTNISPTLSPIKNPIMTRTVTKDTEDEIHHASKIIIPARISAGSELL